MCLQVHWCWQCPMGMLVCFTSSQHPHSVPAKLPRANTSTGPQGRYSGVVGLHPDTQTGS